MQFLVKLNLNINNRNRNRNYKSTVWQSRHRNDPSRKRVCAVHLNVLPPNLRLQVSSVYKLIHPYVWSTWTCRYIHSFSVCISLFRFRICICQFALERVCVCALEFYPNSQLMVNPLNVLFWVRICMVVCCIVFMYVDLIPYFWTVR